MVQLVARLRSAGTREVSLPQNPSHAARRGVFHTGKFPGLVPHRWRALHRHHLPRAAFSRVGQIAGDDGRANCLSPQRRTGCARCVENKARRSRRHRRARIRKSGLLRLREFGRAAGRWIWSAGDSKIVAPDSRVLALANNRDEMLIHARLDLSQAGRKYAREALREPKFLRAHWKAMLAACQRQLGRGQRNRGR